MKPLQDRIVTYVVTVKRPVSLEKLLSVSTAKGFSEDEVLAALQGIGKRLKSTVRQGEVYYSIPTAPKKRHDSHVDWLRDNYPRPSTFVMPFPEIDMSWMFLKSKDERDAFMAEMSGRPRYTKTNGNPRRKDTKRNTRRST